MSSNNFNVGYWQKLNCSNTDFDMLHVSEQTNADIQPIPYRPIKTHPKFSGLEIDNNGNVDSIQFDEHYITAKFNKVGYAVNKTKDGVVVYKNGKEYVSYTKNKFNEQIYTIFENGKPSQNVVIRKGRIESSTKYNLNDASSETIQYVNGNVNKIKCKIQKDANGESKVTYYRENGNIEYVICKNGRTEYAANKPFYSNNNDDCLGIKYIKDAVNNNDLKFLKTFMSEVNPKRILTMLSEYKEQTGADLIDELGSMNKEGVELVNFIEKQIVEKGDRNKASDYVAEMLYKDINKFGAGDLKRHVNLINRYNVGEILNKYKAITNMNEFDVTDFLTDLNEKWIGTKAKEQIVNHIIDCAKENSQGKYCEDILEDIDKNCSNKNWHNLSVDIVRLCARAKQDPYSVYTKPNGKFENVQIKQGETGDCWLVANIIGLCSKPQTKKALEDLIKILPNGDAQVTLKGANKTYLISAKDVKNSNHLSSGDGDVRLIEIAFDKYRKEQAYENIRDFGNYNLDGGFTEEFVDVLFGKNLIEEVSDINLDFINDPNRVVAFGIGENFGLKPETPYYVKNSKGANVKIEENHQYVITGADENNIYIINPWDSGEKLFTNTEDFKKLLKEYNLITSYKLR